MNKCPSRLRLKHLFRFLQATYKGLSMSGLNIQMGAKAILYEPVIAWLLGVQTKDVWFDYTDIRASEIADPSKLTHATFDASAGTLTANFVPADEMSFTVCQRPLQKYYCVDQTTYVDESGEDLSEPITSGTLSSYGCIQNCKGKGRLVMNEFIKMSSLHVLV